MFEKMKELNLSLTSIHYNCMMTLYEKTGQPERIPEFIMEMKAADVKFDTLTYNIWMRANAEMNDISGVEHWTTYSNLASIYIDSGLTSKAENALKELEKKNFRKNLSAFQHLITLYGKT
nr:pentatricopeptide repeat-containing protein At1g60770 [Tanacetum cinerariifolium]